MNHNGQRRNPQPSIPVTQLSTYGTPGQQRLTHEEYLRTKQWLEAAQQRLNNDTQQKMEQLYWAALQTEVAYHGIAGVMDGRLGAASTHPSQPNQLQLPQTAPNQIGGAQVTSLAAPLRQIGVAPGVDDAFSTNQSTYVARPSTSQDGSYSQISNPSASYSSQFAIPRAGNTGPSTSTNPSISRHTYNDGNQGSQQPHRRYTQYDPATQTVYSTVPLQWNNLTAANAPTDARTTSQLVSPSLSSTHHGHFPPSVPDRPSHPLPARHTQTWETSVAIQNQLASASPTTDLGGETLPGTSAPTTADARGRVNTNSANRSIVSGEMESKPPHSALSTASQIGDTGASDFNMQPNGIENTNPSSLRTHSSAQLDVLGHGLTHPLRQYTQASQEQTANVVTDASTTVSRITGSVPGRNLQTSDASSANAEQTATCVQQHQQPAASMQPINDILSGEPDLLNESHQETQSAIPTTRNDNNANSHFPEPSKPNVVVTSAGDHYIYFMKDGTRQRFLLPKELIRHLVGKDKATMLEVLRPLALNAEKVNEYHDEQKPTDSGTSISRTDDNSVNGERPVPNGADITHNSSNQQPTNISTSSTNQAVINPGAQIQANPIKPLLSVSLANPSASNANILSNTNSTPLRPRVSSQEAFPSTPPQKIPDAKITATPDTADRKLLVPDILAQLEAELSSSDNEPPASSFQQSSSPVPISRPLAGASEAPSFQTTHLVPNSSAQLQQYSMYTPYFSASAYGTWNNAHTVPLNRSAPTTQNYANLNWAPTQGIHHQPQASTKNGIAQFPAVTTPLFIDSDGENDAKKSEGKHLGLGTVLLGSSVMQQATPAANSRSPRKKRRIAEVVVSSPSKRSLKTHSSGKAGSGRVEVVVPKLNPGDRSKYRALHLRGSGKQEVTSEMKKSPVKLEDESRWNRLKHLSMSAPIPRSCGWEGCNATLMSGLKLSRHLVVAHGHQEQAESNVSFQCQWSDCYASRFSEERLFHQHVKKHAQDLISCPFQNCEMQLNTCQEWVTHERHEHNVGSENRLRPKAQDFLESDVKNVQPIPERLPTYLSSNLRIYARPISDEYHGKLGPWVLHNSYGHVDLQKAPTRSSQRQAIISGLEEPDYVQLKERPFFYFGSDYNFLPASPPDFKLSEDLDPLSATQFTLENEWLLPDHTHSDSEYDMLD